MGPAVVDALADIVLEPGHGLAQILDLFDIEPSAVREGIAPQRSGSRGTPQPVPWPSSAHGEASGVPARASLDHLRAVIAAEHARRSTSPSIQCVATHDDPSFMGEFPHGGVVEGEGRALPQRYVARHVLHPASLDDGSCLLLHRTNRHRHRPTPRATAPTPRLLAPASWSAANAPSAAVLPPGGGWAPGREHPSDSGSAYRAATVRDVARTAHSGSCPASSSSLI